jgi:Fur family peroxide stress response transcriptional regulator
MATTLTPDRRPPAVILRRRESARFANDLRNRYPRRIARPPHIRNAVAELIDGSSRHDWSIEEIGVELEARGLTADFSSLYRAVEALVGDGELHRVELGTSGSRFERAADHHEHVRCERCGAVAGVSGCVVEQAVPAVERLTGFAVTGHEILFRGLCPDCAASGSG